MLNWSKIFLEWLVNKIPEGTRLGKNDVLLANIVLRVNREATSKGLRPVLLSAIKQIHPLDRGPAAKKMRERVEIFRKHKEEIVQDGHISTQKLNEFAPSITLIRTGFYQDYFVAFEGNSRVAALQEVFAGKRDITVDVEVFTLPKDSSMLKDISQLRKRYGLE